MQKEKLKINKGYKANYFAPLFFLALGLILIISTNIDFQSINFSNIYTINTFLLFLLYLFIEFFLLTLTITTCLNISNKKTFAMTLLTSLLIGFSYILFFIRLYLTLNFDIYLGFIGYNVGILQNLGFDFAFGGCQIFFIFIKQNISNSKRKLKKINSNKDIQIIPSKTNQYFNFNLFLIIFGSGIYMITLGLGLLLNDSFKFSLLYYYIDMIAGLLCGLGLVYFLQKNVRPSQLINNQEFEKGKRFSHKRMLNKKRFFTYNLVFCIVIIILILFLFFSISYNLETLLFISSKTILFMIWLYTTLIFNLFLFPIHPNIKEN